MSSTANSLSNQKSFIPNAGPSLVDVPIVSKNLQRNVILVVAAVTGVIFTTFLTYPFIRPHLMDYNSHISNIQNSIKCKNEPQNTLMPGCRNNLYCQEDDPAFKRFTPFYRLLEVCVNDRTYVLFEGCKRSMEENINDYLNSTSYAKQLFDKFYFETVVRFAP